MAEQDKERIWVADESDLAEGLGMALIAGGTPIALFKVEGQCYAIANACPHRGGPLAEGDLEGHVVHCPWHGWAWDLRTGLNERVPSSKVACFPVTVEAGSVFVQIEPISDKA
jgi:nitrite reductase (NADH) small subunit